MKVWWLRGMGGIKQPGFKTGEDRRFEEQLEGELATIPLKRMASETIPGITIKLTREWVKKIWPYGFTRTAAD